MDVTAQRMDELVLDGETWDICELSSRKAIPSSASLGFRTTAETTANYDGRVDRFGIDEHGRLRLLEM